jgi:phosphate transport system permease protein
MKTLRQRNIRDYIMVSLLVLSTVLVLTPLLIIIGYVIINGLGAISIDFFTQELGSPARAMQGQPTGLVHTS